MNSNYIRIANTKYCLFVCAYVHECVSSYEQFSSDNKVLIHTPAKVRLPLRLHYMCLCTDSNPTSFPTEMHLAYYSNSSPACLVISSSSAIMFASPSATDLMIKPAYCNILSQKPLLVHLTHPRKSKHLAEEQICPVPKKGKYGLAVTDWDNRYLLYVLLL